MSAFKVNNNTFNGPAVIGSNNNINISDGYNGAVYVNQNETADTESAKDRGNCSDIHDNIPSSKDSPSGKKEQLANNNNIHRPIVFISYSWDCESHKNWVKRFAIDLKSKGIDVICDQETPYGMSLLNFMKSSIYNSDRTLIIGTPEYLRRSREKGTGCQFEDYIITENIYNEVNTLKFIPILRTGTFQTSFPPLIARRKGLDFSIDIQYNKKLDELVRCLFRAKE